MSEWQGFQHASLASRLDKNISPQVVDALQIILDRLCSHLDNAKKNFR